MFLYDMTRRPIVNSIVTLRKRNTVKKGELKKNWEIHENQKSYNSVN